MKARRFVIAGAILALLVPILFVVSKFIGDQPVFAEGPVSPLGNEQGAISPESLEKLERLFEESSVPSMAAAVVVGDEMLWAKGFGEQPDLSTVYMIGSIDKTFITTAIMQLWEEGLLDLDDDINDYLPYTVRHPEFPEEPITIEMLLKHTSGLPHDVPGTNAVHHKDGPMVFWELVNQRDIDGFISYLFPPSVERLGKVFEVGAGENPDFWLYRPGIGYQYSNTAFYMLLVPVIEAVSGQSYFDYLQEHVFDPLEMANTSFVTSSYPRAQLAVPYEDFRESGYRQLPLTGMSASGKMRSSVIDLASYLMAQMNQGSLDDQRILEPESAALMHKRHRFLNLNDFPPKKTNGVGLSWFMHEGGLTGHSGFVPGLMAEILFSEHEGLPYGMVLMMTKSHSKTEVDWEWWRSYYVPIIETLLEEGRAAAQERAS